jgi:predicted kinase
MCGVGFAGKSTLAKKIAEHLNIPLVSQDALFFEKKNELNLKDSDDNQWQMLLDMCKQKIRELLIEGKSVVFDNVNLKRQHRDELKELARAAGAGAVVIYLDTPEEILNKRQERNFATNERHNVKQEYLDDAKIQLEIPSTDENVLSYKPEMTIDDFIKKLD